MIQLELPLRGALAALLLATLGNTALAESTATPNAGASSPQPAAQAQELPPVPSAVTIRLLYVGEVAYNALGGLHDGASYTNSLDLQTRIDTGRAFGWNGGKILAEGFYTNTTSVNRHYVDAVQDPSVIDTGQGTLFRLYQLYYEQRIGRTDLLFGIYDIETEFGVTRPMDIFMNGAYAWTSTLDESGVNGPSTYPNTALGFRVRQRIGDNWTVRAAVLDGVPDSVKDPSHNAITLSNTNGAFVIAEVDYAPSATTKIMAGVWDYTGKFDAINSTAADGSQRQVFGSRGAYVGGATQLYDQGDRRGISGFTNIGFAGARTNEVDGSLNVGLTYTGPLESRARDKLGVAFGVVKAGDAFRQAQSANGVAIGRFETNAEITYRAEINTWLTVQPDIQYWTHPGFVTGRKNDLLMMLHFEIGHAFGL